jgi:hypothetical protein
MFIPISVFLSLFSIADAMPADLILHHGKIVTVDGRFSIHETSGRPNADHRFEGKDGSAGLD